MHVNQVVEDHRFSTNRLSSTKQLVSFADGLFSVFDHAFDQASGRLSRLIGEQMFDIRTSLDEQHNIIANGLSGIQRQSPADCRILIACGDSLDLPMTPQWSLPVFNHLIIEAELASTQYRVHHYQERDFWQFFCLKSRRGVQLMRTPQSLPDWDSGSPLRNFLQWHLSDKSVGLVHAGVLGTDGRGALFFGPGKSGKSGTILAGILHGLQSLGDDYVLVKITDSVNAMPLFSTLKCDPVSLERLGINQGEPWAQETNWQGKKQFVFKDITTAEQPSRMKIDALCLPEVVFAKRTTIKPMDSKEAFLSLAPTGVAQIPGGRAQNFSFCAELTRSLPAYRISLGVDPVEITETLATFIAKLRS
ncbi:serine kinase [Orrella marina]|uniref:Serine kinase n=1 Tax=Orrella marina TaxID=2163011 RepID=A0A2R4XGY0_9BURK|nr:serine kinase [Orrella marina]